MKEEAEKKLQRYIRQLDHFERARRDEETPLIEEAHRDQACHRLYKPSMLSITLHEALSFILVSATQKVDDRSIAEIPGIKKLSYTNLPGLLHSEMAGVHTRLSSAFCY